jgi:hypothetical protein
LSRRSNLVLKPKNRIFLVREFALLQKNPHQEVGIKEGIVPSGLSGTGLVFGVFDLKPIVAYAKANPLGGKCGKKRSV